MKRHRKGQASQTEKRRKRKGRRVWVKGASSKFTDDQGFLSRVFQYGEKMYKIGTSVASIRDTRRQARIPVGRIVLSYMLTFMARLGSLNMFEQYELNRSWLSWLGGSLPSADTMGRVALGIRTNDLRCVLGKQHRKNKRNKVMAHEKGSFRFLVLDGHEGVSSYKRRWKGCLSRIVHFKEEDRTQYYCRYVAAYLTDGRSRFMLDAEAQQPGEGEIDCAVRLLKRLFEHHSSSFEVVCGDALYMNPDLWKLVRKHRKHIVAVLKDEKRDLVKDFRELVQVTVPVLLDDKTTKRTCWDIERLETWPQFGESVRVVRSMEETITRSQIDGRQQQRLSEWLWATSLPVALASTETIVRVGHRRWHIENYGFNELCNYWHADHACKYDSNALMACLLILFFVYNLFHTFITRNLKPAIREGRSEQYWAELISAEFRVAFHRYSLTG